MVNINLSASSEKGNKEIPLKKSLIYSIVIVVVWLGTYAGVILYKFSVEGKVSVAAANQANEDKKIKEGNNKDIFDFQTRLVVAKDLVSKKDRTLEGLNKIQELIVKDAHLNSYDFNEKDGKISIAGQAADYSVVARQILSLKKSDYLSAVEILNIGNSQDGEITFALKLVIK